MVASYGTCHVIGCAIFALHGGRALGEFGMSRETHTHGYILPSLCKSLPVYDEICRRSANFLRACILHNSILGRTVGLYGIIHGIRPLAGTLCCVCAGTVSQCRTCCLGGG